jgi:hypothetical protein
VADVIEGFKALAVECAAAGLVIVHHLGKDPDKGARGHSSIEGSVDTLATVRLEGPPAADTPRTFEAFGRRGVNVPPARLVRGEDHRLTLSASTLVGPCYDLHANGKPYRVVVLPMETGEPKQHRTVEQRTKDVLDAGKDTFRDRNQHMQGVTFALRLAFGLAVDEDIEHIQFEDGSSAHLFEAYAMTNLLMCSAVDEGYFKSRATGPMRKSCSRHMRETIGILQPTLVISQGKGELEKTLGASLGVTEWKPPHIAMCDLDGNRFVRVSLRHPSRGNWHSLKCTYLHEVVVPAITEGRKLALSGL